jgi:DNA polymerase
VRLYPLYHPAAALYTPSTLEMLRAAFLRIPEILKLGPPPQPEREREPEREPEPNPAVELPAPAAGSLVEQPPAVSDQQLGLF